MMMSMLLEANGYQVSVEASSRSALATARAEVPDVCLLDIGLPDLDGYQLARRIRAMPGMATGTLIAITGYGQAADREKSLEAGFDHHLVKPVDPEQLAALLESVPARGRTPCRAAAYMMIGYFLPPTSMEDLLS